MNIVDDFETFDQEIDSLKNRGMTFKEQEEATYFLEDVDFFKLINIFAKYRDRFSTVLFEKILTSMGINEIDIYKLKPIY